MKNDIPLDTILIFKTNIRTEADRQAVKDPLDSHACIQRWNVDLHDVDCVLRIVSPTLSIAEAIALVNRHGYECTELL
jgi:hypothetical protein